MPEPPNDYLTPVIEELIAQMKMVEPIRKAQLTKTRASLREMALASLRYEPSARQKIDGQCLHWIEHGVWLAGDVDDAVLIWARLNEAQLFGRLVWSGGFRVPENDRAALLRFLLIHLWDTYGVLAWRERTQRASSATD